MCRFWLLIFILSAVVVNAQVDHWESIIIEGDEWSYLVPSAEPAANWKMLGFDDTNWGTGPSGFGYSDNDDQTILPTCLSVYLRKEFSVIDINAIENVLLHLDYDDGYVAYLNGVEIGRDLLTGNPPAFDQSAFEFHEAQLYQGQVPASVSLDVNLLNSGTNVLAIQVHNENIGSSDFSAIPILSVGINNTSYNYKPLPSWFIAPISFSSSNLPLVLINTIGPGINNQFKTNAGLGIIYNGPGQANAIDDPVNEYSGFCGIKIRGESSQTFAKKSYAVELWDEDGNDIDSSFLNFPKEEDFILYGPFSDKTLINNVMAMEIGRKMGRYASRTRMVELVINGSYEGVYVLMEKIKRDNDRVDIAKLESTEISGDDLTGGYIFRIDKGEYDGWYSNYNIHQSTNKLYFQYYYPNQDEIIQEQKNYIQNYMDDFEAAIAADSGTNNLGRHYTTYINLRSFIDTYLLNELSKNVDAYRLSTYFHKDKDSKGGKITAGPFWDFNLSFGNGDYCSGDDTEGLVYYQCPGNSPFWWDKFLDDNIFRNASRCRWKELREDFLSNEQLNSYIDSLVSSLSQASDRNFERWPILGSYIWPNPYYFSEPTSYAGIIAALKTWMSARLEYMDDNLPGEAILCEQYDDPNFEITSVDELPNVKLNGVKLYPNPSSKQFNIESQVLLKEISITNVLGKVILLKKSNSPSYPMVINHNLPAGVYFVKVKANEGSQVLELVVQ